MAAMAGGQIVSTATRLSVDVSTLYILRCPTEFVFSNILGGRFLTTHRSVLYQFYCLGGT